MIKKNSLSWRIIIRVLPFTTLLFIMVLSIFYFTARSTIEESTRENAIHIAHNAVGKIEQELQPMEKLPEMIAALMEIDPPHEDSLFVIVETILEKNENVSGAAIAFEPHFFPEKGLYYSPYAYRAGDQIHSFSLGSENYEYFYMDWYLIPKMLDEPYWTEPYYDEGGGEMLMSTYSVPFYKHRDGERVFAGIATVDVSLEWLTQTVEEIEIFETGYAFMVSRNGVAVAHPKRENIMNESLFSLAEYHQSEVLRDIGQEMIAGHSRFREHGLQDNGRLWIYYTPLPSSGWSIGVVYPDAEMFANLRSISTLMIILVIGGLILLTFITMQIISRISAPLTQFSDSARTIAEGNFDVKLPEIRKTLELKELHDSFSHMQEELAEYVVNLKETTAAKEKIESELRIAREIQLSMIPHSFPPYPDLPQVDLYALLQSAREVGGDLYDFFVVDQDKFVFAIGDVSGKGVPASLFMAVTRTLLRTIADKEQSPSRIMAVLNKSLSFNNESNMFVTFFLGVMNLKTGEVSYANAGHNPPVRITKEGEIRVFEPAKTIPLGLYEDFEYPESKTQLEPGEKIFAYTDGVSEAENVRDDLFDEERMLKVLEEHKDKKPRELIDMMMKAIEAHVQDHPQSDDITMMTVLYNGQGHGKTNTDADK